MSIPTFTSFLLAGLAGLLTTGCVACEVPIHPKLSGTVVQEDGRPIIGAIVRLDTYQVGVPSMVRGDLLSSSSARTNDLGTWKISSERKRQVFIFLPDGLPKTAGILSVAAPGYTTMSTTIGPIAVVGADWPVRVPVDKIVLAKKP